MRVTQAISLNNPNPTPPTPSPTPSLPPPPSTSPTPTPSPTPLFQRYIPSQVCGVHPHLVPSRLLTARNRSIIATCIETLVSLATLPVGLSRVGAIGRVGAGVEVLLTLVSLLGLYGAVRMKFIPIIMHAVIATSLGGIFAVYIVLAMFAGAGTQQQQHDGDGGEGEIVGVVIAIVLSNLVDIIAGLSMSYYLFVYSSFEEEMKKIHSSPPPLTSSQEQQQQQQQQQLSSSAAPVNGAGNTGVEDDDEDDPR